jgi:hypothetical protein
MGRKALPTVLLLGASTLLVSGAAAAPCDAFSSLFDEDNF